MIKNEGLEVVTFKYPPHRDRSYLPSLYASGDEISFMFDSFVNSAEEMIDHFGVDPDYLYFHEPMFLPDGELGVCVIMAYGYHYHYRINMDLPDLIEVFKDE